MRKLKRRVEELEVEVEQLKKEDRDSKAEKILTWLVGIFEIIAAIAAVISSVLD